MSEAWLPVAGFEDVYDVSDLGRVRSTVRQVVKTDGSLSRIYGGILKPEQTRLGYLRIRLSANGRKARMLVHRLVARAFLPAPPEAHFEVNHKNGTKGDNRAENLEWCDRKANVAHALKTGLRKRSYGDGKGFVLDAERALAIYRDTRRRCVVAAAYGVSPTLVSNIKQGRAWVSVTGAQNPGVRP